MRIPRVAVMFGFCLALSASSAVAQPLGSFRWQLQPYCNVVSVNVTQQGAIYTLDGIDDRCGGGNQAASVVGIAYLTPLGLVGFGLTSVLPGGTPIHTEATITIASLSGTWRDSAGNNGSFIYTPGAGIPGAARPIPSGGIAPASITNIQLATNAITTTNIVDGTITNADLAAAPRIASTGGSQTIALTTTAAVIRTVSITAPTAGNVLLTGQGFFTFDNASIDYAGCSISATAGIDGNFETYGAESGVANAIFIAPFGLARTIAVTPGTHNFYLVCRVVTGSAAVWRTTLNALFIGS